MKTIILASLFVATSALVSCNNQTGNPYGAPAATAQAPVAQGANPYAVPQVNGETGSYTQNTPYQPIPGVSNTLPPIQPSLSSQGHTPPVPSADAMPQAGSTIPHTVQNGDSLWKLSRQYDTTVKAIQAANGLSGTNIQLGQIIQIPNN